jgi:signal transduction histidine kinase
MNPRAILHRSLAARLALVYGLINLVVVTLLGLGVYLLTERYLLDRAEDDLGAMADFYAAYTATTAPDQVRLAVLAPQIVASFAPQAGYDVRLFSARNGTLLAATHDLGRLPSNATLAELRARRPTLFILGSQDLPDRLYVARPSPPPAEGSTGGQVLAVVEVSRDVSEIAAFLGVLRLILVGAGGLLLAVSLAASLLLARQMTRPLRQMELATRAIAAGDFDRRLDLAPEGGVRGDEIGRLAASVNQMAADLAHLEAARRDFIARVSHDLRTPLTAIKGFVVNLQDMAPADMQPSLATMDEQADRLIRLVDDLLILARLQRGKLRLHLSAIDLAAVARSAAAVAGEKAGRLGIHLALDLPPAGVDLVADADRLQQVMVNLLDNALRATPAGGTVCIRVAADGQEATLIVVDDGQGLTPEEAEHAFEPYVRGPGGGAGLGLAIAREIVVAHGGRIWLAGRPEGGAEAGFGLPRYPVNSEAYPA